MLLDPHPGAEVMSVSPRPLSRLLDAMQTVALGLLTAIRSILH